MLFEIIMSGFGGQGIMYMGDLFGQAAVREGNEATYFPTYGVAMRGGTANCLIKVSDESIGSPLLEKPDAGVFMNQPSMDKFQPLVKAQGVIVANASIIRKDSFKRDGEVEIIWIPATELAKETVGTEQSANIVALGALLKSRAIVNPETIEALFRDTAKRKDMVEKNLTALRAGFTFQPKD